MMELSNGTRAISEMRIEGTEKINLLDDKEVKEYVKNHLVEALSVVLEVFKNETGGIPTHAYMYGSHVDRIRDALNEHNRQHPEDKCKYTKWDEPVRFNGVLLKPGCDLSGAKVVIVSWKGCEEDV